MNQLHWRNSFRPIKWTELSSKQRETILESHIFIKKKRTGEVKGRTVAGGNKQRDYIDKEESSSPTVATESVILTSMVDAIEEREIMVIDVPNAFIQTVVEDESKRVIIRIRGMLVDILVKIVHGGDGGMVDGGWEEAFGAKWHGATHGWTHQPVVVATPHRLSEQHGVAGNGP